MTNWEADTKELRERITRHQLELLEARPKATYWTERVRQLESGLAAQIEIFKMALGQNR
jgi:hypothetical protein